MEEASVILVDEHDNAVGMMEKIEAHRKGKLHRAFSVLVFDSTGKMLLQKRAKSKYHSGGLWSNACCSHPRADEELIARVRKQLLFEMGIDAPLKFIGKFNYQIELNNSLIENEIDHVFVGKSDAVPSLNYDEAEEWKYESFSEIRLQMKKNPEEFTYWFKKIMELLPEKYNYESLRLFHP